jgi:hypothetical protein
MKTYMRICTRLAEYLSQRKMFRTEVVQKNETYVLFFGTLYGFRYKQQRFLCHVISVPELLGLIFSPFVLTAHFPLFITK